MSWKPGLPPGAYYPGMEDDYEVRHTPGGAVWHRRKRPLSAAAADAAHEATVEGATTACTEGFRG
jgi:hypothetical protein